MLKLNIQLFAASKSTTFSESTNISANTSTLTINIYFSANNNTTYFSNRTLNCSCYGQSQSANVTLVRGGSVSVSFTFYNLGHNADGTGGADWAWDCNTGTQVLGHIGDSGRYTFATIPRQANVTGANNFNDEQNPYMTFNNPGGFRINARLEFAGTYINKLNVSNTGNYTFNLTSEERKLLRQKCAGNSMTVRYVIATCIGGTTENYWSWADRTMTIVNGNPIFSNFDFEDSNEKTVSLTGDNKSIISAYSRLKITIPESNKAVATKEASMRTYRIACGDGKADIEFKNTGDVIGEVNNPTSATITNYAIDSRNNSTLVTKQANKLINYTPLIKGNISVLRSNGVSNETILNLEGTFNNINFGKVINSIKIMKYRYKTPNADWSPYIEIEPIISENKFGFNSVIKGDLDEEGFDINNSYQIEVYVEDELSSVTYTSTLGSGTPNIALAKNGVGIMGKYDEEVGGDFQIRGRNPFKIKSAVAYMSSGREDTASANIPFDQLVSNTELLTLQNGGIRIGKGIKYVSVSGQCFLASGTNNSYLWTNIKVNTQEVSIAIDNYNTYFASTTHSPRIVEVKEGDVIFLHRLDNTGGTVRGFGNTYLSVTILE